MHKSKCRGQASSKIKQDRDSTKDTTKPGKVNRDYAQVKIYSWGSLVWAMTHQTMIGLKISQPQLHHIFLFPSFPVSHSVLPSPAPAPTSPSIVLRKKRDDGSSYPFRKAERKKSLNLKLPKNTGEKGGGDVRRGAGGGEEEGCRVLIKWGWRRKAVKVVSLIHYS